LSLLSEKLVSKFAFTFNLYRCSEGGMLVDVLREEMAVYRGGAAAQVESS
jgi:hypothetical protein